MTKEGHLQKAITKTSSALLHVQRMAEEDAYLSFIVGDLQRALERLQALYSLVHHGKTIIQGELFD